MFHFPTGRESLKSKAGFLIRCAQAEPSQIGPSLSAGWDAAEHKIPIPESRLRPVPDFHFTSSNQGILIVRTFSKHKPLHLRQEAKHNLHKTQESYQMSLYFLQDSNQSTTTTPFIPLHSIKSTPLPFKSLSYIITLTSQNLNSIPTVKFMPKNTPKY